MASYLREGPNLVGSRRVDPVLDGGGDDQGGEHESGERDADPEDPLEEPRRPHPVGESVDGGGLAVGPAPRRQHGGQRGRRRVVGGAGGARHPVLDVSQWLSS